MDYGQSIELLGDWFLERPMDVVMEAGMQSRLVEILRCELRSAGKLWSYCPEPPLTDDGSHANYKQPYIDEIAGAVPEDGTRLSRVHPEVNVSDPAGPNEQIDVIVLDKKLSHPLRWNDGSKRIDERDLVAAF